MYYDFGRSNFTNFVWINRGAVFVNPDGLDIEMITPGRYGIEVYRRTGLLIASVDRSNQHGGWTSFYFTSGGEINLRDGAYKIKLVNLSPGMKRLKQGTLEFRG